MINHRFAEYLSRTLLAFLAFMNVGYAIKLVVDQEFVENRLFNRRVDPFAIRLLVAMSIVNCAVYIQSAIYIFELPTSRLSLITLLINCFSTLIDSLYYKTIKIQYSTYIPLLLNILTLAWLLIYLVIWRPWLIDESFEEKLIKRASTFKSSLISKTRKLTGTQQQPSGFKRFFSKED